MTWGILDTMEDQRRSNWQAVLIKFQEMIFSFKSSNSKQVNSARDRLLQFPLEGIPSTFRWALNCAAKAWRNLKMRNQSERETHTKQTYKFNFSDTIDPLSFRWAFTFIASCFKRLEGSLESKRTPLPTDCFWSDASASQTWKLVNHFDPKKFEWSELFAPRRDFRSKTGVTQEHWIGHLRTEKFLIGESISVRPYRDSSGRLLYERVHFSTTSEEPGAGRFRFEKRKSN